MNPIAVWHHAKLSGPIINTEHAAGIMAEQMRELALSGLLDACEELIIGCSEQDAPLVQTIAPAKAHLVLEPNDSKSELPTIHHLRAWLPGHPNSFVFYHHIKCATRDDPLCHAWRRCMQHYCVRGWANCVSMLATGHESTGAHWLTPEVYPGMVKSPFWGGNFFWGKASFLLSLPELPFSAITREDFFLAESWIGMGPRRPSVFDFAQGQWPSLSHCSRV